METALKSANITNFYGSGSGKYVNPFEMVAREKTNNLFEESYSNYIEDVDMPLSVIYEEINSQPLGQIVKGFIKDMTRPVKKMLAA